MFKIKFDGGFSDAEQTETTTACGTVAAMSAGIVTGIGSARFKKLCKIWFGNSEETVIAANLRKMDAVIQDANRTVTFVYREGEQLLAVYGGINVPPAIVEHGNHNNLQVGTTKFTTATPVDTSLSSVYAFVFPAQRGGTASTSHHVGSGMRLYLATAYTSLAPGHFNRPHTIYHELTHKTLGTEDHMYEGWPCRNLALNDAGKAATNADSYAWFAMTYAGLCPTHVIA